MTHARTLGIDLGTDRLLAAVTRAGAAPVALDIGDGSEAGLTAQVALGDDPDEGLVLMAYPATRPYALFQAERVAYGLLRLVGRTYASVREELWTHLLPYKLIEGERGDVHIELRNKSFSPEQLLATLLGQMGGLAKDAGCKEPLEAAVALPVSLSDAQRRAVARAAQLAGFGGLAFVHAPLAAALELARRCALPQGHSLLVLDWGAGALEGAIVTQQADGCALRAVVGDNTLGGMDLDAALVEAHVVELTALGHGALTQTPLCRARLGHAWRRARERMGEADSLTVHLPHLGAADGASFDGSCELSRQTLDEHLALLLQRAEALVQQLIAASEIAEDAPVTTVLLGGMCSVPSVHKRLEKVASKAWRGAGGAKPIGWAKLLKDVAAAQRAASEQAQSEATDTAAETTSETSDAADEQLAAPAQDADSDADAASEDESEGEVEASDIAAPAPAAQRAELAPVELDENARSPAFVAIGAALFGQRMNDNEAPTPTSRLGAALWLAPAAQEDEHEDAQPNTLLVPHNTALPHSHTMPLERDQTTLTLLQGGPSDGVAAAKAPPPRVWLGEVRIHGVTGKNATATFHIDIDGLIEVEARDAKGHALEVAWLARPGLTHDELMALARAAWVSQQRREERIALVAAEERASALVTTAERQLESLGEDNAEVVAPLEQNIHALNEVLAQPLDLQQIELFEHERADGERSQSELPPSPRQLRCERLTQQIYTLEIALGRAAQAPQRAVAQEAAS